MKKNVEILKGVFSILQHTGLRTVRLDRNFYYYYFVFKLQTTLILMLEFY